MVAFDSLNFYVLIGGSMLADILYALEEHLPVVKGMEKDGSSHIIICIS